ncbi:MAG: DUF418 domain-containing transporter, partial [Desulfatitalea sp.]
MQTDIGISPQRWTSIDALRGLAVLLMITQHVAYWVCFPSGANWVVQATGALGGLAAPIFVTLSGWGVAFTSQRNAAAGCDRLLIIRGLVIMGYGFLMNLLTPDWFAPASWYVLHLLGLALILAPLLRRVSNPWLLVLIVLGLVATVIVQNMLETPFRLYNEDMAAPKKPGGVLRFALAEGFFPLLPWIAFFISGLLAGRWLLAGQTVKIVRFAFVLIAATAVLAGVYSLGFDFTRHPHWIRFFTFKTTFYPAMTPITLFLMAVALLLLGGFVHLEKKSAPHAANLLVNLGRTSLTLLIVHVAVIRESVPVLGLWHRLSPMGTIFTTVAALLFFTLAAAAWRKIGFKYGAEWLLRR